MKLRRKIAKAVAVLMMATCIPVFGASTNGVDKVITVEKGGLVEEDLAPKLKIQLKDDLAKGQEFYIQLENAEWEKDVVTQLGINPNFKYERESDIKLVVEAKKKLIAGTTSYDIPLMAKITGDEAKVEIISNETVVTSGKYTFAEAKDAKSIVVVGDIKAFALQGEMSTLSIEEQYTRAFKSSKEQTIRIELTSPGIEFNYNKGEVINGAVIGKRAYEGQKYNAKIIDATTLEVKIPADGLNKTQKGTLDISGIKIKATKRAAYGDVKAVVTGDFNDRTTVTVGKYEDYATELKVAEAYEVTAGQELKDIEFTLGEVAPGSFNGEREITFTFSEEIEIKNVEVIKSEGLQAKAASPAITIVKKDNKNTNIFKVEKIPADKSKTTAVTFKATLKVPASFKGNIDITAEGRPLEDTKKTRVAKVTIPVEVNVTPLTAKIGLAQQEGGEITITETDKGKLSSGKIFLAFEDESIKYRKAPKVTVTEGNIKVDSDAKVIQGGLEITINSRSTKASTIQISGGEFTVPALLRERAYLVRVGGTAISAHSADTLWNTAKEKYNDIDEIIEQEFMYLTDGVLSNKAEFIIGQTTYSVNGVQKAMDTAAYLAKEGRTMLPVRYVADALGIPSNHIIWDAPNKAVIILATGETGTGSVIKIEIGNKEMIVNSAKVPMSAAAEMKDNRVFIPVAEIARALGADVKWDPVAQIATFN